MRHDFRVARIIAAGALEILFAVIRIRFQHHTRGAPPVGQFVRPGADWVFRKTGPVKFHYLTRDRCRRGHGEDVIQVVIRCDQTNDERVRVGCFQTGDGFVVVEFTRSLRLLHQFIAALQFAVEQELPLRLVLGVEHALDAVYVIARDQLAFFSLERGIGREENAALQFEGVGFAVGGNFRQRGGGARLQFDRSREVIVLQQGIKNVIA